MTVIKPLLISLLITLCLTSCSPQNYTPTMFNAPLFEKKHQFNACMGVTPLLSDNAQGSHILLNTQASWSITDHVALMGNFNGQQTSDFTQLNNYTTEVGMGYYSKGRSRWINEVYLGFGLGSGRFTGDINFLFSPMEGNYYQIRSTFNKAFLQYDGGIKFKDGFIEIGGVLRGTLLNYKKFDLHEKDRGELDVEKNYKGKTDLFFEPGFFFRCGNTLKFQTQIGYIAGIHALTFCEPITLNVGFVYSLK